LEYILKALLNDRTSIGGSATSSSEEEEEEEGGEEEELRRRARLKEARSRTY